VVLALLGAALYAASATAAMSTAAAPTFTKDVAPILFEHCVNCHRPGEIAASQTLLSYDSARTLARSIKVQVATRAMPPWPADPGHSLKFRNDPRLTQKEIDTLVAWVDAGAPQGNPGDLPSAPSAPPKWSHPEGRAPDAVLSLPEVSVAATGEIPYVQQRVKVPLTADKWIVAMQVRAGNGGRHESRGFGRIVKSRSANGVGR
jgi:mono/diheme cytochrome c family protein